MEALKPQTYVNRYGVLIMITAGQILAKAVVSSKSEYLVQLDPKEYPMEQLRRLTVNDIVAMNH